MFPCPLCGGNVGEASCIGCKAAAIDYECSQCHMRVPNPKFRSDVVCPSCGKFVAEHNVRSIRHVTYRYICHHCFAVLDNPKFTNFLSCANCAPPRCHDCNEILGISVVLDYSKCPKCGRQY